MTFSDSRNPLVRGIESVAGLRPASEPNSPLFPPQVDTTGGL